MADAIMALDERLARLEMTVASGFSEQGTRITRLEEKVDRLGEKVDGLEQKVDRLGAKVNGLDEKLEGLNSKLDVSMESLEAKMQLVAERVEVRMNEIATLVETMGREWRADRRLVYAMLKEHRVRIESLESTGRTGAAPPPTS